MATSLTRYADQKVLNKLLRGVDEIPAPGSWYVGLLKYANGIAAGTPPNRDNVVEVNAADHPTYNRKALGATTLTPVNGQIPASVKNDAQILWDEATTDWGTIVGLGIFDAANDGNLWIVLTSPIDRQRTIRIGDRLNVPANEASTAGGLT